MKFWSRRGWLRQALTILTLALVPLLLVGVYAAMQAEFRNVKQLRETTEATIASRDLLSELLAIHADGETGVRGYVITADEAFLQPYSRAVNRRDALFDKLKSHSDTDVKEHLPKLRALSDAKLASGARNVADVEAGRPELARARIAEGRGKRLMDDIRREIASLDTSEVARLERLTAQSSQSRIMLERSVTLMLIGIAIVLALVTLVVSRSFRLRSDALDEARQLHEREMTMFDGAVDGMLLLDERGHILRMNPSISRMFGYAEHELVGKHNLCLMRQDYSAQESQRWLDSVGAAGTHGAGRRQEFTGKRADGSIFDPEVAISRVAGEESRRYVAAIRDISDRKRAERVKNEFVSTVSHELRTPLTSIGGSLALLGAGAVGPLGDKAKRLVDIAHSNCERLVRLINDILDIEKIESGKMEFDLRRMQVAPLVQRTVSAMTGFADKHGVTIHTTLPPWPQCVVGDPDKLEQLLTNLLSNAVKHAPEGSEVEVFSTHEAGMVRIEVRDRGDGVPEEFRGRIFGKFAMADASDSRVKGGTGLGLAIAREIARRHGGEVGFDDRAGGGTVFHFDLPMVKNAGQEKSAPDPALPRILHLDDDQDTLSVVASAFAGRANLVPAYTLAEARDLLAGGSVDAAILDVGLAYENGLDIVPELRRMSNAMPIVLFTATDESREASGVDRTFVKSRSSVTDLADAVLRLLDGKRMAA